MKKLMKTNCITASIIFILLISGCTPSLVYSPSINLPPEPLNGGQFQITGGVGMLAEARPHRMDAEIALGQDLTIRYSPFDRFTLQIKGWKDISNNLEDQRSGASYTNIILLNDINSTIRIGLVPTGAFLFVNNDLEGGGGAMQLAVWLPKYWLINSYIALGAGFGIREITDKNNQWGWGYIGNVGIATLIGNHITLNLEISGIKQVNEWENITHYILAPSFNVGFQL